MGSTTRAIWKNATSVTSMKWSIGIPSRLRTVLISALRPASRAFCSFAVGSFDSAEPVSIESSACW
jgi:hypothetical protein